MNIDSLQGLTALQTAHDLQSIRRNKDMPVKDDQAEAAAYEYSQFISYMLAEAFTKTFEAESFAEEMVYSTQLPNALGTILADSVIGDNLQEQILSSLQKGKPFTAAYSRPLDEEMQQVALAA